MKIAHILFAICVMAIPFGAYAQTRQEYKITDEQKSVFATVAQIAKSDFSVPKMIDVPLSFDDGVRDTALVIDESGAIIPSTVITNTQYQPLQYTVTDSFDTAYVQNMVDGAYDTYVEFPFVEGRVTDSDMTSIIGGDDDEMRMSKQKTELSADNIVHIDLVASRAFTTDTISLQFGAHVTRPTHIRIATVNENGAEKVILPQKFFNGNTINFPQEHARHYRLTLTYVKPLRISEITFSEKGIPQTVKQFVRFIAAPENAYEVYFNAQEPVRIMEQEKPNFSMQNNNVVMVQPISVLQNPLYKKSDKDGDGVMDRDDNCGNISNDDQKDEDRNAIGDACEDFDHDAIINARDNCPNTPNRGQDDGDQDGIGDMCDEKEDRFIERNPWIPSATLIVVFVIVTLLILRTFKNNDKTV